MPKRINDYTFEMPLSYCFNCGQEVQAATNTSRAAIPEAGNLSICFYCGHFMAFAEGGRLRALTADEQRSVRKDPGVLKILFRIAVGKMPIRRV